MDTKKHSVVITAYEYDVLRKNSMISMACAWLFPLAIEHDDDVELVVTLGELTELIGFVAAEANHARSKRKSEDLNDICDYLESIEQDIKRQG